MYAVKMAQENQDQNERSNNSYKELVMQQDPLLEGVAQEESEPNGENNEQEERVRRGMQQVQAVVKEEKEQENKESAKKKRKINENESAN